MMKLLLTILLLAILIMIIIYVFGDKKDKEDSPIQQKSSEIRESLKERAFPKESGFFNWLPNFGGKDCPLD